MRSAMFVGVVATLCCAATAIGQVNRGTQVRSASTPLATPPAEAPRAGSVIERSRPIRQAQYSANPITRWAAAQNGQSSAMPEPAANAEMSQAESAPAQGSPMPLEAEPIDAGVAYGPHAEYAGPTMDHGCSDCAEGVPCDTCGPVFLRPWSNWNAGFALAFLQPRYSDNLALTVSDTGASSATASDSSFDYDIEFSPRVWLQWCHGENFGWRVQWWQLDQSANEVSAEAPASGLGNVAPTPFADIDISISAPGEILRANSELDLYALDLEGMRWVDFGCWSLLTAGGVRFASIEQDYLARATNAAGEESGSIQQSRSLDGFGPTFFIEARRPVTYRLSVFSNFRASLLFGEEDTTLRAGEDLDLASAFTTERTSTSDNLLPILETQWGFDWRKPVTRCHDFYFAGALEGQWWSGVGTAANGDADLGLLGFVCGFGLEY